LTTEQDQRHLEKYRHQQRVNRLVIGAVIGFLSLAALVVIALLLIKIFRPPPTFTPSTFHSDFQGRQGQTVRITGEVKWIEGSRIRITDGSFSIYCEFTHIVSDLSLGDVITVQGKVDSSSALKNCEVLAEP
jgi:cytochrome c-type biogenesis protein CcmE